MKNVVQSVLFVLAVLTVTQTWAYSPIDTLPKFEFTAEEIPAYCDKVLAAERAEIAKITAKNLSEVTMQDIEQLEDLDADTTVQLYPVYLIANASTDENIRKNGFECHKKWSAQSIENANNEKIFNIVKAVKQSSTFSSLSLQDQKLVNDYYTGFQNSGMTIEDEKLREEVKAAQKKLSILTTQFSENINNARLKLTFTEKEMDGIPENIKQSFARDSESNYIVTTSFNSDFKPFMQYANDDNARKRLYLAYVNRANPVEQNETNNLKVLKEILALRLFIANSLGHKTYVDMQFATGAKMAPSVATVLTFLKELRTSLEEGLEEENNARKKIKCQMLSTCSGDQWKDLELNAWEVPYYNNIWKQQLTNVDPEEIKQYFPIRHVTKAMFEIYEELLGIRIRKVEGQYVWHESVELYEVAEAADGTTIGYFYLDLFPRDGKYQHAAIFPTQKRREFRSAAAYIDGKTYQKGDVRYPAVVMLANFPAPIIKDGIETTPSLLPHDNVTTFFHEFGHIMHGVLSKTKHYSQEGTSVARDFVEAPSQMLENWVWKKESLQRLSKHYQTGQVFPDALLQNMIKSAELGNASHYTYQIFLAETDLLFHLAEGPVNTSKWFNERYQRLMKTNQPEGSNRVASFGHLTGYAVGYYGYLWSKVFAEDMFTRFAGDNLFSPTVGMSYRKEILEKGGSEDAMTLIKNFLGREPNQDAFLKTVLKQ